MREKIERIGRGEFDERVPELALPGEPVSWEMEPEQIFTGYFKFYSQNDQRIRGYMLSSDGNLKIKSPQFYGKSIKLEFTYCSKNMVSGDRKKGKLILITNGGEFLIPFEVTIRRKESREEKILP